MKNYFTCSSFWRTVLHVLLLEEDLFQEIISTIEVAGLPGVYIFVYYLRSVMPLSLFTFPLDEARNTAACCAPPQGGRKVA